METGRFYFLSDQYFADFPDPKLMQNREIVDGVSHDRPCYCAFEDAATGLYWMVPFSSRVAKFRKIYQQKLHRRGVCDTIAFGAVLGYEKAFLLQNMCPVTDAYVKNTYTDAATGTPVRLNGAFRTRLIQRARKVLALQRSGVRLIFPDVLKIERALLDRSRDKDDEDKDT